MIRTLEGILVSSQKKKRAQVSFNEINGLIEEVGDLGVPPSKVDYYYDDNYLIFAGVGDVHVHAREDVSKKNNYKEDFLTASYAAINGGVQYICDMPNNPIPPIDDKSYLGKVGLLKKSLVPTILYAGIGPATRPLSFKVPYKVYMCPSVGELYFYNLAQLDETLMNYQNQYVSFHCEDPNVLAENEDKDNHQKRRPEVAEEVAIENAIRLIGKYHIKGKICHCSLIAGLDKILEAKEKNIHLTTEVTPQHLYYSTEEIPPGELNLFQMNPPIRSRHNRKKLLDAFLEGKIDFLATDHAPHLLAEKEDGMSGLTGLDTLGPFMTWLLLDCQMDPCLLAKIVCENPADFFNTFLSDLKDFSPNYENLGKGVGYFKKGHAACFTVLDLKKPITITEDKLKTKCEWSPFLGEKFPGQVEAVFVKGLKY